MAYRKTPLALGSSGTVKGIIKVLNKGQYKGKQCKKSALSKLLDKTICMTPQELKSVPYLEEKRIQMFGGGNILLNEILEFFSCSQLKYSDAALKEGLLKLVIDKKKSNYSQYKDIDFSSPYLKEKNFTADQIQSLPSIYKVLNKLICENTKTNALTLHALTIALICNHKKLSYSFSNYAAVAENYPFYSSYEDYQSVLMIFRLMLETNTQDLSDSNKKILRKIALNLKLILWCNDKDPMWYKNCIFEKKTLTLNLNINNFLYQKQFDQIKKSIEENSNTLIQLS